MELDGNRVNYRVKRNWENVNLARFPGMGEYDIPQLLPETLDSDNMPEWIGFNYVRGCDEPELHGVHFFLDDYQFMRVWSRPEEYASRLSKFKAVCTPDFSLYMDFPKALRVYNHYRKHWLGAYWQRHGVKVIPTICWASEDDFCWCFDGEPVGGCVAVSSVGTQKTDKTKAAFRAGYLEMMRRLMPEQIVFYGDLPDGLPGNILQVEAFHKRIRGKNKLHTEELIVPDGVKTIDNDKGVCDNGR